MELTGKELAEALEVDRSTVTGWVRASPPVPSTGTGAARRFRLRAVWDWAIERERTKRRDAVARTEERLTEEEVKAARDRQTIVESRLREMDLAEREATLVAAEDVEAVGTEIGDRLRAVLINIPSNYVLHLERSGVAPEKGQAVLEEIAEELTRALRGAVEELGDGATD